jgi:hypothetical protein
VQVGKTRWDKREHGSRKRGNGQNFEATRGPPANTKYADVLGLLSRLLRAVLVNAFAQNT